MGTGKRNAQSSMCTSGFAASFPTPDVATGARQWPAKSAFELVEECDFCASHTLYCIVNVMLDLRPKTTFESMNSIADLRPSKSRQRHMQCTLCCCRSTSAVYSRMCNLATKSTIYTSTLVLLFPSSESESDMQESPLLSVS